MLESGYQQIHVDNQFRPVVGERLRPNKGIDLIDIRRGRQRKLLKSLDRDAPHAQEIIGLDASGKKLLLVDRTGRDKSALQTLDLETLKIVVAAEDSDADISPALVLNRFTNEVVAASSFFGDGCEPFGDDLRQGSMRIQVGAQNVSGLANAMKIDGNKSPLGSDDSE